MACSIDDLLDERQISVSEVARRAGLSTTVVWNFFRGKDVYATTIKRICEGLDIGFFQLMGCWEETRKINGIKEVVKSRGVKKGATYYRPRNKKTKQE